MKYLNYKRFRTVFLHLLNNRSIRISDISRNAKFNPSYLYNLINHSQNRVTVKTVTRIFKGMNYNDEQIHDLINRIELVHPIHTQTRYMEHHRQIKHENKVKHIKHVKKTHWLKHKKRYRMNGLIMHLAKQLDVDDKQLVINLIKRLLKNK